MKGIIDKRDGQWVIVYTKRKRGERMVAQNDNFLGLAAK